MSEQTNDTNDYRFDAGLSAEIVERLSREKNDPDWMREFRLRSLEIYNRLEVPDWGPDISGLDMDHIATYVRPKNNKMQNKWEDVPEEIRDTFTQLGIPQRRSTSIWPGSAPSTTRSWSTTMSARKWRDRASSTWTSKALCTRNTNP